MVDVSTEHRVSPPVRTLLQTLLDDRVLVSAVVVCIVLIGYQLTVTLLQPPWIKPVTDWLRTALAWPQLAVVAWVAVRLHRTHRPDTVSAYWIALGMLSYAVARTTWTIADEVTFPHGVPFPSVPDLFFILQYPCFIAALFLFYADGRWLPGVRVIVDGVLWMSAVTALSWYFVLLPLSLQTRERPLSKSISMFYQVADLVLFYGLVSLLAHSQRTSREWLIVSLVGLAVLSLFVADTWAALLLLRPPYTYRTGSAPDLFWFTCYILVPLVSLIRLRVMPGEVPSRRPASVTRLTWRDVLDGLEFVSPSVVVVGAAIAIFAHAALTSPHSARLSIAEAVGAVLLLLAMVRPAVVFLEHEQVRRERDAARAEESTLRSANAQMQVFLTTVGHELRTPLTSLIGNVQLMARRVDRLSRTEKSCEDCAREGSVLHSQLERCDRSLMRMKRLVEDVLDEARVQQGRLALRLEPCDLAAVVGEVVVEQAALNPERSIRWVADVSPVPVMADATRIEQVVANYMSNALKYSPRDQAIEVRLRVDDGAARVSVHDEGMGVLPEDLPHIWDQFYQATGAAVQHGSQIGFGLGLHLSKAIIEGHHGQVGIESALGQGTTVWFTLPLVSVPSQQSGAG